MVVDVVAVDVLNVVSVAVECDVETLVVVVVVDVVAVADVVVVDVTVTVEVAACAEGPRRAIATTARTNVVASAACTSVLVLFLLSSRTTRNLTPVPLTSSKVFPLTPCPNYTPKLPVMSINVSVSSRTESANHFV